MVAGTIGATNFLMIHPILVRIRNARNSLLSADKRNTESCDSKDSAVSNI
jgi:hypothetical protein